MLTHEIKRYIDKSVLCWLATSSLDHIPNVSPKEVFAYYRDTHIIIANIASPQTVRNIKKNHQVCVSFIDVFVQKGYQLKGVAEILDKKNPLFEEIRAVLEQITQEKLPFATITSILITQAKPIIAPKYILYPGTTEQEQIQNAMHSYGIQKEML